MMKAIIAQYPNLLYMNRTLTIVIGTLFLFALGGFMFFFTPNTPASPADTSATTPYENQANGFSLAYPSDLGILEYTPEMATIGRLTDGGVDGVADVRVMIVEGTPGASFTDAAVRDLASLCAADGPTSSFSCTGIDRVTPFATDSGASGFEVYLKGELRELESGAVTEVRKGPYYGFLLSTSAGASKILIVHAPLNQSAEEADAEAIRAIAKSASIK